MATWALLKELRLQICDPVGVIDLVSIADQTARLAVVAPAAQTAYQQADTAEYWTYDAELVAWERVDLELSDARSEAFIDNYGVDRAPGAALRAILAAAGKRLGLTRSQAGAESQTYQLLADVYRFYKDLAAQYDDTAAAVEGTSTGRYLRMRRPRIAGGM